MTDQSQITNHKSQITGPTWFAELQEAAQKEYEALPAPSRKDENWRFGNLKQLDFDGFTPEEESEISFSIPDLPEPWVPPDDVPSEDPPGWNNGVLIPIVGCVATGDRDYESVCFGGG